MLRGQPAQVGWLIPSEMRRLVAMLTGNHDLALVVTCRAWWGPLGIPTVVDHVDALSLNQARRARGPEAAPIRLAARIESVALRRHERRIAASVAAQVATAAEDAAVLTGAAPITVIPVAWDGAPAGDDPPDALRDIDIVVTGVMRYPPNVAAARRFAGTIVPLVRRRLPAATAWVVGRDAAGLRLAGVEVASDVPDLHAFLRRAKVALAPLEGATGTPYKVLEAAACGAAVVTTPAIAERFSLRCPTAVTDAEFAERAVALLADDDLRRAAVRDGAAAVRDHSGAAMAARLEQVLRRAAATAVEDDAPMRGARLRQVIRASLHGRGLELPRRGVLRSTMGAALAPLARRFTPATVIDVGVAWGTPGLLCAFPHARLLLIEPLAEFDRPLRRLAARRGAHVVRAAAGRQAGSIELNVTPGLSDTSAYRSADDVRAQRRTVPVTTIDAEVERLALPGPYVLKIDVQGGELDVLAGATTTLRCTELILLEASLFDLYEGAPDVTAVVEHLDALGFALHDVFGGDRRPLDGALAQVDLAFARRDGVLRREQRYGAANAAR